MNVRKVEIKNQQQRYLEKNSDKGPIMNVAPDTIIKSTRFRWEEHLARMG